MDCLKQARTLSRVHRRLTCRADIKPSTKASKLQRSWINRPAAARHIQQPQRPWPTSPGAAAGGAIFPADEPAPRAAAVGKTANWQKLSALGVMFFCSTFIYTILQNLKDSIVVTTAGAEVLPFLEAYGVLPLSLLFFTFYSWLTKSLPEKLVYYAALTPFLAFYAVFAAVLYPLAPMLHPYHLLESWQSMLPSGLVGLAAMGVNWLYSLFFIVAELWGGVAISVLFWGLADDVCSMQEAKDVYAGLGIVANVGLVLAGAWVKFVNSPQLSGGSDLVSLRMLVGTILVLSVALFATKAFVDKHFMPHDAKEVEAKRQQRKEKKEAKKQSQGGNSKKGALATSFEIIKRSTKVKNLAVLVVAYFFTQKLFDFTWKAQLRVFYPSPTEYQRVLADVSQYIGITTIVLMAISKYVFRFLGWGGAALMTPILILATGSLFFVSAIVAQRPEMVGVQMAALVIPIGAMAGIVGRVVGKAAKYSLFDPAKEMVYISMHKEEKQEGKAAVDLLGSYFGKSGASWVTQALVLGMGTLTAAMPFVGVIHVVVCLAWTKATFSLARSMWIADKREKARAAVAAAKAAAPPCVPTPDHPCPVPTDSEDEDDEPTEALEEPYHVRGMDANGGDDIGGYGVAPKSGPPRTGGDAGPARGVVNGHGAGAGPSPGSWAAAADGVSIKASGVGAAGSSGEGGVTKGGIGVPVNANGNGVYITITDRTASRSMDS